ncbi:MAG TPA: hypothetical protein VIL36_07545 [Acidimicrobiales bacterium]
MSGPTAPQVRRRIVVVAGLVAAALLLVGAVLVRSSSSHNDGGPSGDIAENQGSADGASDDEHSDSDQNEAGAVRAAIASVGAAQRWFYLSDDELVAAVSAITTEGARDRLVEQNLAAVRLARESFAMSSGRVWWVVRPLAWKVDEGAGGRFRVAVWTVTVLSAIGVAVPQSTWSTVHVDLEWVDGAWRVDDMADTPGPTPMTGPHDDPWNAEPFDTALEGFARLETEPVP